MLKLILAFGLILPLAAQADEDTQIVVRTVQSAILPGFADLAAQSDALSAAATADCRAANPALRAAYHATFDRWLGVETYRAGPLEQDGQGLAMAFWPDPKGAMPRALTALLSGTDIPTGDRFAETSVAARGLFALEAMLYDPAFNLYGPGDPGCRLTQVIAADLARTAAALNRQWTADYAPLMLTAGVTGNTRFLSPEEVIQQLFTAALTELDYVADTRIARPLGDDRARPNRAEARASARSVRNVALSVAAVAALAQALAGTRDSDMFTKLDYVADAAAAIRDPAFGDADTPSGHFRLVELQNAVRYAHDAVLADLGTRLGVAPGFNALDGD